MSDFSNTTSPGGQSSNAQVGGLDDNRVPSREQVMQWDLQSREEWLIGSTLRLAALAYAAGQSSEREARIKAQEVISSIVEQSPLGEFRFYSPDERYVAPVLQQKFKGKTDDGLTGEFWVSGSLTDAGFFVRSVQ